MRGVASRAHAAVLLGGTATGLVAAPLAIVHLAGPPWRLANGAVAFVLEWVALCIWASIVVGLLRAIRDARRAGQHRSSPLALLGAHLAVALTVLVGPAAGAASSSTAPASPQVLTLEHVTRARPTDTRSVVVKPGDSLWSIAEATTGSGLHWRAIAEANLGRRMDDGRQFTDPSVIHVGWVLELPPPVRPAEHRAPSLSTEPPAPSKTPHGGSTEAIHERTSPGGEAPSSTAIAADAAWIAALGATNLAWLGMSIAAARRRQRLTAGPPAPVGAGDLALARLCAEVAQSGLGLAAAAELAAHVAQASTPAVVALDGSTMSPPPIGTNPPAVALPLGVTAGTSQVLVVAVGSTIALHGAGADALATFQQHCLGWWPWCETQVGTTDPAEVAALVQGWSDEAAGGEDRTVVFFGAPSAIDEDLRRRCVTVTSDAVEAAMTVVVEDTATSTSTGEVVESFPLDLDLVARVAGIVEPNLGEREPSLPSSMTTGEGLSDLDAPSSPALRLLCAVPRLEHLVHPIEPRRVRRATEVAAYLALHREQPTTGDRLRSVVLGSGDLDASPKTLANTLSALRRSLGVDATGTPICTRGSKTGRYQVSEALRTDLDQLLLRVELARQCHTPAERLALLRSAVELIEAPPLDAHLLGYDWLHAEGHLLAAAARLTEAVVAAVDDAVELGLRALAEHLVNRARMLDPFDDRLVCCQLTLAASSGGRHALERSFAEHERQVHRLEPGAGASSLVEATRRRLLEELLDQASLAAMEAAPRSTKPSAPAAL